MNQLLRRGGSSVFSVANYNSGIFGTTLPKITQSSMKICGLGNVRFYSYETLAVNSVSKHVMHVELNRPKQLNAMNKAFWREIRECFQKLNDDSACRAVVLSGSGKHFTSGLDLADMTDMVSIIQSDEDIARKCKKFYALIKPYQDSFTSLEKCSKPVIAAVHGACIGGGVDLISSADIRYATQDAWFQIKEVDLGLAADVGTLQRFPKIVGSESLVRELALSARKFHADEALTSGFVSRLFSDKSSMIDAAVEMASRIASKSPVAVQGTKVHLIYSRDHSVEESLEYQARWNMSMLQSQDLMKAAMAMMNKTTTEFDDL